MVNVVAPQRSVHGTINLALTVKALRDEGRKAQYKLIPEKLRTSFWSNLREYADISDNSLIILDMPHPELDALKKLKLKPWEAVVLYIPSDLNAPNRDERDAMVERGISVVPPRKTFECFVGDLNDENKIWIDLSKILSMEEKGTDIDSSKLDTVKGIAEKSLQSPKETIDRILKNDVTYFQKLGKKRSKPDLVFRTAEKKLVFVEAKRNSPRIFGDAFETCLQNDMNPVVIGGAFNAILTIKPHYVLRTSEGEIPRLDARFGKGAVIRFQDKIDPRVLSYIVGLEQQPVVLRFSEPKFISSKSLRRRLLGGTTSQKIKGKTYEKKYSSLRDRFPGLTFLNEDLILVPDDAFEDTIALLHESGSSYELMKAPTIH